MHRAANFSAIVSPFICTEESIGIHLSILIVFCLNDYSKLQKIA